MQLSNKIAGIGAIIGFLSFTVLIDSALAGGGLVDNSISTTNPTPAATGDNATSQIATSGIIPNSLVPSTLNNSGNNYNQQSGGNQFNSYSPTLTPPNCNGGCFFAITKASPTSSGSGANLEAMIGVNIPFSSNDGGAAERERLRVEMDKYRSEHDIRLALSEKLAEALENGKMERATIIAMNLAPMLGYKDYQLLLKAVSSSKPTSPQIGNR